jgi:hypothetical protein
MTETSNIETKAAKAPKATKAAPAITDLPKPAPAPKEPAAPVIFESREKEPSMFDVAGIRSTRNFSTGRLEWEVPAEDVERFEQHHFIGIARVVRKAV